MTNIRIAISSTGNEVDSDIDSVFGRCPYFIIVDIGNKKVVKTEAVENASAGNPGGAGVSAAKFVADMGVDIVVAGSIGPRAADVFKQFKIRFHEDRGPIKKFLQKILKEQMDIA